MLQVHLTTTVKRTRFEGGEEYCVGGELRNRRGFASYRVRLEMRYPRNVLEGEGWREKERHTVA
jgi:hypothetical protein